MSVRACVLRTKGNPRTGTFFMSLLVVIPFYFGDKDQAVRLAEFWRDIGGVKNHDCLLVMDKKCSEQGVIEPCREAFKSIVGVIRAEEVPLEGKWGTPEHNDASGPNEMWLTAMQWVMHKSKQRWLWMEPDAVPTRPTSVDEIEVEDRRGAKPFTGAFVDLPAPPPPAQKLEAHMSGIGVYPINVPQFSMSMALPGKMAWDYAGREDTVIKKKAHFTKLIQHEYRVHGESPTFPNMESLLIIRPETAIFHRCKDASLISRLREKFQKTPIVIAPEVLTVPMIERRIYDRDVAMLKARIEELEAKPSAVPIDAKKEAMRARMAKARAARGKKVAA